MQKLSILGISGSLRENSTNTIILKNLAKLLPAHASFELFDELHRIPPFSPGDVDGDAVKSLKEKIAKAAGVIICTPEYAFGVPGVLKNALDWTVSTGELNKKPVAAISASPLNSGGDKALASLLLTLTALGTAKNEKSTLAIPNVKSIITSDGITSDDRTIALLQDQVNNLFKIIGS